MNKKRKNLFFRFRPGTTLLDTVLALLILGFMIALIGTLQTTRETNRRILHRSQAAALADEQLNALRRMDVTSLPTQTNGPFIGTIYNAGTWSIVANGTGGHTAPNVLELPGSAITGAVSGRLLLPAGAYGNATLEAKWLLANDSPAAAAFGFLFRSSDSANGYRLRLARTATDLDTATGGTQNVLFEKIIAGVATKIDSRQLTVATDTWYTVRIVMSDTNISLYLNGTQMGSGAFVDTAYLTGTAALLAWGGAHVYVDDVQTITTATDSWNFDSSTDLPAAWIRLGLNDLPDSTAAFDDNGLLTLSVFPVGSATTSLKQATVTVRWLANGSAQSYSATGLIGRSGVGL